MTDKNKVTYIGTTDFRNQQVKFGIKEIDRSRHMYIIGKTGMGKSTVLENLAVQDIVNGEGIVFIDPHGSAIEKLLDYIPQHRIQDVIYFAPFDTDFPISFNVMEDIGPDKRHLVVNGLMASFKKIWQDAWSERMAYILTNTLLALLETPGTTLLGVNRMYAEKAFRDMVIGNITDNSVKSFWLDEYNKWDVKYAREATAAIQNKIGQFTGNPLIRNIIGQQKSSFDFRTAMDQQKIILVNLSKGLIGEENMRLLGGMLITKLYLAGMSRADVGTYSLDALPACYFFVDEFQNFANESFADILAEARKYKLSLTVANQYIAQMEEVVRDAVFGNVGTTISFRVGPFDAEVLERAFMPVFTQEDLVNIAQFQMYLTLSIDAVGSKPFSARGLPPIPRPEISFKDDVIRASRATYAQPRAEVEARIAEWFTPIAGAVTTTPDGKERKPQGASAPYNPNYKADKVFEPAKLVIDQGKSVERTNFQKPPVRDRPDGEQLKYKAAENGVPPKQVRNEAQKVKPAQQPPTQKPQSAERTHPPVLSNKLQTLLDQIEAPAASVQSKEKTLPQEPAPMVSPEQKETPKLPSEPMQKKQQFTRAADDTSKQALRDLLKRVNSSSAPAQAAAPKTLVADPQPSTTLSVAEPPAAAPEVSQPRASQQDSGRIYSPGQPKEVPEDILRKVLE